MIISSRKIVAMLMSRNVTTTSWVGTMGVRPFRTTNVRKAEIRAKATAIAARMRRNGQRWASAFPTSKVLSAASAVVMPAKSQQ